MASITVRQNTETGQERADARRADRYSGRSVTWGMPYTKKNERLRSCGRWSVKDNGEVSLRVTIAGDGGRRAGFAGYATCGSVWACPVCSEKIAAVRQAEVQAAVEWWEDLGGSIALATFTVSHNIGQSLLAVWEAVSSGWGAVISGRAWIKNSSSFGIEGWCRVLEVTHGEHGWHVHVHTLLFLHHDLGGDELAALRKALYGRWETGIGKKGFRTRATSVNKKTGEIEYVGTDIRMMEGRAVGFWAGGYFVKLAEYTGAQVAALEVTGARFKDGKNGSRTPFQILAAIASPDSVEEAEQAAALWIEWEAASKGKRQMRWSKGFRELMRFTAEVDDETIAATEVGSKDDDVVVIEAESVRKLAWCQAQAIALANQSETALTQWLDERGFRWRRPEVTRRVEFDSLRHRRRTR